MEGTYWFYNCHEQRRLDEITALGYKCTGRLWNDLANIIQSLSAYMHPSFKEQLRDMSTSSGQEIEIPNFLATSFHFDVFSFKILIFTLTTDPVRMLRFNNCGLSEELVDMLQSIIHLDHINWIQLDWNPGLPDRKYIDFLKEGTKLQTLSLRCCNLGNEAIHGICEALKTNKTLKALDLYGNCFNTLTSFAGVLETNRYLVHLNLAKNNLTDDHIAPFIGVFGRLHFPDDKVEEYRKKEKDLAKAKALKSKGKQVEPEPPADELVQDEESKQFYLIKNKVFKRLNLSLNNISSDHYLRLLLHQVLPNFKLVLQVNPIPESVKRQLAMGFADILILN
ncbi:unnamed protein product [Blepharisma stoltei]|uniref:Uncharacterized protein n=1 Tax=Blepharisma stoltei TaxID=1481888 RepID=A0AAU9JQV9_9CILI|nr:unnamed protein product [Blepharisma stoltei]